MGVGGLFLCASIIISRIIFTSTLASSCIKEHNKWRSNIYLHGLRWNKTLAADASAWSQVMAKANRMYHSGTPGENLYSIVSSVVLPTPDYAKMCISAVDRWGSEKTMYTPGSPIDNNYHLYGHYTQMVWRETTHVGCGGYNEFFTCRYYPSGNTLGVNPF